MAAYLERRVLARLCIFVSDSLHLVVPAKIGQPPFVQEGNQSTISFVLSGMKWVLFLVSLALAGAVFYLLITHTVQVQVIEHHFFGPDTTELENQTAIDPSYNPFFALCAAFGTLLLWPIIGAVVAELSNTFREWAYIKCDRVGKEEKIVLAAIWPLTFLYALIVYPAMAIINRLFRPNHDDDRA